MLRLALIGSGRWGSNYIQATQESGLGEICAIRSRKLVARGRHFYLREEDNNPSLEEVLDGLDKDKIDAAFVATHPPDTGKITLELLRRGVSVMAEKPFTFKTATLREIEKVLDGFNEQKRPIFLINHQHLFSNSVKILRGFLSDEVVTELTAKAGNEGPYRSYSSLWDYGPHPLSMLFYLGPKQLKIINYSKQISNIGEAHEIVVTNDNGFKGTITVANNLTEKVHFVILRTSKNEISYDDTKPKMRLALNGKSLDHEYCKPLTCSVTTFLNSVLERNIGGDPRFGTALAARYTELISSLSG